MTSGYVTDSAYVSEYHPDHAPTVLNMTAVMNGYPARPLDGEFTWADFGCADGLTACSLAAAYPKARFYGIDFAADAIGRAQKMADETGLTNVTFMAKSFTALTDDDVPLLDFAVVYGVYTYIDDALRQHLMRYIVSRLKPGGLLLVAYNSLPGWGQILPLRARMLAETADFGGPSDQRAAAGVAWLKRQRAANPKFFRDNKLAEEWADDLQRRDPQYVAHEFFNALLHPRYGSEVIHEMATLGLGFAGSTTLFLNMLDLAVPSGLRDEFAQIPDRATFEDKRDFLRNETFRRDVYVNGGPFTDFDSWRAAWMDTVLGTTEPLETIDRQVTFGDTAISYTGEPFDAILELVAQQAVAVDVLPCDIDLRWDAGQLLLAGGQIVPFAAPSEPVETPPGPGSRFTMPIRFNRQAAELQLSKHRMVALTSPVLGGAMTFSNINALLLVGLCEAGWDGAVSWTREHLRYGRLMDQGKQLKGEEAQAFLERTFDALAPMITKLVELGILQVV